MRPPQANGPNSLHNAYFETLDSLMQVSYDGNGLTARLNIYYRPLYRHTIQFNDGLFVMQVSYGGVLGGLHPTSSPVAFFALRQPEASPATWQERTTSPCDAPQMFSNSNFQIQKTSPAPLFPSFAPRKCATPRPLNPKIPVPCRSP